jgi:hypothetical protein
MWKAVSNWYFIRSFFKLDIFNKNFIDFNKFIWLKFFCQRMSIVYLLFSFALSSFLVNYDQNYLFLLFRCKTQAFYYYLGTKRRFFREAQMCHIKDSMIRTDEQLRIKLNKATQQSQNEAHTQSKNMINKVNKERLRSMNVNPTCHSNKNQHN